MKQLTKIEAIELAKSGEWKNWTDEEIVKFQLFQDRMCMDFSRFHNAMNNVLNRPVFMHEFGDADSLIKEYLKLKPKPTLDEIISLLPKNSTIILTD